MTNKLELFELAGYLQYELMVLALDIEPSPLVSICTGMAGLLIDDTDNIEYYDLKDIKPLVVPLSKLTESEWVQVFKAGNPDRNTENITIEITEWNVVLIRWVGMIVVEYDIERKSFSQHFQFNQLAAFAELYKLHADVHGLIERGVGLDKTIVK